MNEDQFRQRLSKRRNIPPKHGIRIPAAAMQTFIAALFTKAGLSAEDAQLLGEILTGNDGPGSKKTANRASPSATNTATSWRSWPPTGVWIRPLPNGRRRDSNAGKQGSILSRKERVGRPVSRTSPSLEPIVPYSGNRLKIKPFTKTDGFRTADDTPSLGATGGVG